MAKLINYTLIDLRLEYKNIVVFDCAHFFVNQCTVILIYVKLEFSIGACNSFIKFFRNEDASLLIDLTIYITKITTAKCKEKILHFTALKPMPS